MNTSINQLSISNEIESIMTAHDIVMADHEEIITDGEIHRFRLHDEDRGRKSGWYVVNGYFLSFGSWKGGKYNVKLKNSCNFSSIDKTTYGLPNQNLKKVKVDNQIQAAALAWSIWTSSQDCHKHAYLDHKQVNAHGLKISGGNIIMPIMDNDNHIKSLHFININGSKWFLKNGEIKGNYFTIGNPSASQPIFISEGYSTAATLYEVTRTPQIVAFNAGNLISTARNIRLRYPNTEIILAADNDFKTKLNVGLTKGKEASRLVNGRLLYPEFVGNDVGSDFNDFVTLYGSEYLLDAFRTQGVL